MGVPESLAIYIGLPIRRFAMLIDEVHCDGGCYAES